MSQKGTKRAKLSVSDVYAIRRRAAAGERHKVIARDFDIHTNSVCYIKSRTRWRHLPEESNATGGGGLG